MADRGQHRGGGRGGGRGDSRGGRGGRGGGEGRGGRGGAAASGERPKKENILDLGKYMDKRIVVKFTGGREGMFASLFCFGIWDLGRDLWGEGLGVTRGNWMCANGLTVVNGLLKGYDALMNLVLDEVQEVLRGIDSPASTPAMCMLMSFEPTDDEGNTSSRSLGLVVARGTLLVLVSPVDGSEEIANPFVQAEE